MSRGPLPPPAPWAIRTCPEAAVIETIICWRYPPPSLSGDFEGAREEVAKALGDWRRLGLPHAADSDGLRLYDPSEVINFFVTAGLLGLDRFWQDVAASAQLHMLAAYERRPFDWRRAPDARALAPRRYEISYTRTYFPNSATRGQNLRLKLPLPLAGHEQQPDGIALHPVAAGKLRQSDNRAELVLSQTDESPVTLGFAASMTAKANLGIPEELSPADRETFTAFRENLIVVSPAIRSLAAGIAAGSRDPAVIASGFFDHIADHYVLGRVPYHALDPEAPTDWPLTQGCFDCHLGSALLIALCRARQIPARLVSGYQIFEGYHAPHYWSEIWLDGVWRPFDFSGWEAYKITGDDRWRRCFCGQAEYRLVFERYPRQIVGRSSIALSGAWHQVLATTPGSTITRYLHAGSMRPVFEDNVSVAWL